MKRQEDARLGMVGAGRAGADAAVRLIEALEEDCGACAGAGRTRSEQWQDWELRAGELIAVAQAARRADEMHAPAGAGNAGNNGSTSASRSSEQVTILAVIDRAIEDHMKARPLEPQENDCSACGGSGKKLSPVGRLLAEMLMRHGFVREDRSG
ncbi:hypothetical protein [Actinomadura sp. NPDC048394]|uniref:hypothetical protein n=1 Tax=Actinomadura sp. NPDC048394 TaxID=3158223 RepID=UPI0033EE52B9